jgi:hypothetical protein
MRKRSYKEKRPKRLGAMQVERTRHETPSYFRVLLAVGLIEPKTRIENAWGTWRQVCADPIVKRLSMKLKNVFLPSVAAPFKNGAQVLGAMSEQQISALKERIGA